MQLRPDQLRDHLKKTLAPIYLVTGDEPLQHAEVTDAVRRTAREQGYTAREVYEAARDFDWNRLNESAESLSLFADHRLVDLRLPTGRPGRDGGAALKAWAERPPEDTLLLVTAPKLERQVMQGAWFKALAKAGVVITVRPPERTRLPAWIEARMRDRGLQPDRAAVALLAERIEGNLLAGAQEIDKLLLLNGPGPVTAEAVAEAVADSARYGAFDLGDAVLDGEPDRVARIINGLLAEGTAAPLLVWALHRELAQLASVAARCAAGEGEAAALRAVGVWERRQPRVRRAVRRFDAAGWADLLAGCARLDRLAKGAAQGSFRDELIELALAAAGAQMPGLAPRRTVVVQGSIRA